MDAKEEVRARLNIVDVIGEYVTLQRAGRSYRGLSPFTQEKTPSFFVSPDKQIWHCFSTNKGGDIFAFVMEVEGVDFKEALSMLARKAGVELTDYQKGDGAAARRRERLYGLIALATRYFQQAMIQSKVAQDYIFERRRLSKEVVQNFALGYAPDNHTGLTRLLMQRGYSERELVDAGLSTRRRSGLGDLFRGRMMVPLRDPQGRTIGFTGRLIDESIKAPKYLNTPATPLYDKSHHVFGLELAKEPIRRSDYAVVVEGNLDVVSSHQAGVGQVVATAGTAMTEHHLKTIARFSRNIRLCFDGDKAGIAATERVIPLGKTAGVSLSVIVLPEGAKDPDELIQAQGVDAWLAAIAQTRDAVEWVIDEYVRRSDPATAAGKAAISSQALALIRQVDDPVQVQHYVDYLAGKLSIPTAPLLAKLARLASDTSPAARAGAQPARPAEQKTIKAKPAGRDPFAREDTFLAINAMLPAARESLLHVKSEDLHEGRRQQLHDVLSTLGQQPFTPDMLRENETYGKIILLQAEERYGGQQWDAQSLYEEALQLASLINAETIKMKLQNIREQMQQAYEAGDEASRTQLALQYQQLQQRLVRLK
ncbi:DNA primase [Candidatus Saccharibacteria bacterium]|nr:DNA primase [Candidatus Saccharibacteria bacterium]